MPAPNQSTGLIPPTAKQICSGEDCGSCPSKGLWLCWRRQTARQNLNPAANGLFQPIPYKGINQPGPGLHFHPIDEDLSMGAPTHRPQAQHRARISEYPNQAPESMKSRSGRTGSTPAAAQSACSVSGLSNRVKREMKFR